MSTATPTPPKTSARKPRPSDPAVTTSVPPSAPKLRRRPAMAVVAVALVLLGAVLGAWAWTGSTSTVEVVATRTAIARGATFTAGDLMVVRVNPDPALPRIPASRLDTVVGRRAATDVVAGGLVSPAQVTDALPPAVGESVVGIPLNVGQLPGEPLRAGDRVRLVQTPGSQGEVAGDPVTVGAQVLGVHEADARFVVDVLVPAASAPEVAARAGTGRIAIVLDARER